MRSFIFLLTLLFFSIISFSQNNVGIKADGSMPDSSAKLDVQSTTQGLLLPRMTTAQRNAMPKKTAGLIVYDIDKQTLYIYNGTSWNALAAVTGNELQAFSTSANPEKAGDSYGCSVAISGDWAAVGAYGYDKSGGLTDCGAVFIYKRTNGQWKQMQILTASDAQPGDRLGYSVAIDGNRLVAGASLATVGSGFYHGAAYVFELTGGVWAQTDKLTALDAASGDYFGSSVSIEGNNIVIGAPGDDGAGTTDEGCAYWFRYEPSIPDWVQDHKITGTLAANNDKMGTSVSVSGGYALIGIPGRSNNAGYATMFQKSNTTYYDFNPGLPSGSRCGESVCIKNLNIVIGAPNTTVDGKANRGKVFVYNGLSQNGDVLLPSLNAEDNFGSSVSFFNGYLLVGATGRTVNGNISQGEAYLFKQGIGNFGNTVWDYKRKINVNNGTINEFYGQSVSINGFNLLVGTEWPQGSKGRVIFLNIEE